jgi:hypothetical protein
MAHAPDPNPFALGGRGGRAPAAAAPARTWTEAEIAEKLRSYIEIPPEHWEMVRAGTHVRYYTRDEGFRPGGFVAKNPDGGAGDAAQNGAAQNGAAAAQNGAAPKSIRLQSGFSDRGANHFSWQVSYADITRLFAKPDAATLTVMNSLETGVRGLNENIRKLVEFTKALAARVAALEAANRM